MRKSIFSIMAALSLAAFLSACTAEPETVEERSDLRREADQTLKEFRTADAEIARHMDKAYGMAVFPTVGKGGAIVGGAAGRGVVYEGDDAIGYCSLEQATVGLQLGGQSFSELILFENKAALDRFTKGEWAMAAQASAVAAASGTAANARYKDGVMVFVTGAEGLMAEAAIGGQRFKYEPLENN